MKSPEEIRQEITAIKERINNPPPTETNETTEKFRSMLLALEWVLR